LTADAAGAGGSTVRRIMLGSQLRRLREARGIGRAEAGYAIRASESKISRLELGRVSFKERDVADLLALYGVTDAAEQEILLDLAREANAPGWWHRYADVLPNWFQTYVGLEESAGLIRTYELQFVPGLLQSEEYARAVIELGNSEATDEEIDQRIGLRMQRRQRLLGPNPPRLWAVMDEAALRRPIGGPAVMRGQLEHLLEMSQLPNVTVQVMPFKFGGHAAEGGAFTILRFPEPDLPDVVYVETLTGALYLDKRDDVDAYMQAMERLAVDSATPERTTEMIDDLLKGT
jgi:transcriptional regulator with XRE-family HTH domain